MLCEYLFESKIISKILPQIVDKTFGHVGFSYVVTNGDLLDQVYNIIDLAKIVKKHKPETVLELVEKLNDEEMLLIGEVLNYLCSTPDSSGFVKFMIGLFFREFDYYYTLDFINVRDWTQEMFVIKDICSVVESVVSGGNNIDTELIAKLWNNENSDLVRILKEMLRANSNMIIKELIKGLDK